jgi:hypothetical protein
LGNKSLPNGKVGIPDAEAQTITDFIFSDSSDEYQETRQWLGCVFQEFPYDGCDLALLYVLAGISTAHGDREEKETAAYCSPSLLKKIHRSRPAQTDDCFGKLMLLQAKESSLSLHRHKYYSTRLQLTDKDLDAILAGSTMAVAVITFRANISWRARRDIWK